MPSYLLPLLVGLGSAVVLTPVTIWLARRTGVVALPVKDRWSRREVPVLGGVAVYVAFLVAILTSGPLDVGMRATLLGGTLLFLLGLADDVVRLRPATKLVGQVVAASILVAMGVHARFIDNQLLTIPLTIFWVVAITNAMNLIDNMDGLCAGVGTIAAAALAAYALRYDSGPFPTVARVGLALAGAQLGFLVFNVHPARTFMGDSGALFLGFTLACASILGTYVHAGNLFLILAVPLFVLAVPIFDTAFVTIMRKLHRRRVSQGGRDHVSHRLVALGMSEGRAVLVLWGACAGLAGLGVAASYLNAFANVVLMGVAVVAVVIFAVFIGETAIYRPAEGEEEGAAGEEVRKTFANYLRGPSLVLLDLVLICLSYIAAYVVKFDGRIPRFDRMRLLESLPLVIIVESVFFLLFRLYRGVWRYFGVRDLLGVFKAVAAGSLASLLAVVVLFRFSGYSRAVFLIDAMVLFLLVSGSRFLFRALLESRRFPPDGRRVLVVGAGDHGELCLRALRTRNGGGFYPVGFLDPDPSLKGRKILGVPVVGGIEDLERVVRDTKPEELILSSPLPAEELSALRERCEAMDLAIYLAPVSREFVRI